MVNLVFMCTDTSMIVCFSANVMLNASTELEKNIHSGLWRVVGWIPLDMRSVMLTNLTKLTQRVDSLVPIIEALEENLKQHKASVKLNPAFYKSASSCLEKNTALL